MQKIIYFHRSKELPFDGRLCSACTLFMHHTWELHSMLLGFGRTEASKADTIRSSSEFLVESKSITVNQQMNH